MCPAVAAIGEDEFAARFAAAICEQKEACGCSGGFACAGTFKLQFEAVQQYAADNSLHYDPTCAQALLVSAVLHRGCRPESDFYGPLGECGFGCPVYRGDVPTGGACSFSEYDLDAYTNMCAEADEYCRYEDSYICKTFDLPTIEAGEACLSPDYVLLGECAEGLSCNSESRVCVPVVGEGEVCGDLASCGADLFCDGECQPQRPADAACEQDYACLSLRCDGGACLDAPVICLVDSPSDLLYSFTL